MKSYTNSLTQYSRFNTREVRIGGLGFGANHPIRLQSMTTVDTMDTEGSIAQSIRMIEAGCEMVRITAPSKKDAENLRNIKKGLRDRGINTPLVADIHFTPNAAEVAARIVEKVRVNPGNYADKKKFEEIEYTDDSYQAELERIEQKFTPLVKICKEEGIAMRIGTNHGSLSDRILSRYGDTPLGMVESAMEFIRICEKNQFYNLVLSMKASNTLVMVQAYRLLVATMIENGMNYPLHLGVTEAGDGEDGRIKSAVGIGTLLEDGLGDTVRVSLTEEPEFEIPVAKKLVDRYQNRPKHAQIPDIDHYPIDPFHFNKRQTNTLLNIGGKNVPIVFGDLSHLEAIKAVNLFGLGHQYSVPLDKWNTTDMAADYIYTGDKSIDFDIPGNLGIVQNVANWQKEAERHYPLGHLSELSELLASSAPICFVKVKSSDLLSMDDLSELNNDRLVIVLETENEHAVAELRRVFVDLLHQEITTPVIVQRSYDIDDKESLQLHASTDFGALLIDGLSDGIWLNAQGKISLQENISYSFGILQATRSRISKTEYISCPSCGRTLFDLQETTAKIRAVTSHLKGVKIGIMGCIVNGPGEMADADYGYVGTGPGKITLYKEKEVVRRNIPEEEAVDALIDLISEHGDWVDAV